MARPRKPRSPERETAILNAIRIGNTRRAAAASGDMSEDTLARWMAEDAAFCDRLRKAESEAEQRFLGQVAVAATTNWQAAAWWLERRKHADYSRREKMDMSIDVRREAERIAADAGLDPEAVIAEAERILTQ